MTKAAELLDRTIELIPSDPWDFVTEHGSGPFTGKILKVSQEDVRGKTALLIEVGTPFKNREQECRYFVASSRFQGLTYDDLSPEKTVSSNLVCIPKEKLDSTNPFDLSWWRGGVALIATVKLKPSS